MILQDAFLSFLKQSAAAVTHGMSIDISLKPESSVVGIVFDTIDWNQTASSVPFFIENGFESVYCPWVVVLLNKAPIHDSRSWEQVEFPSKLETFSYSVGDLKVSTAVRNLYSDKEFLSHHFSRLSALNPEAERAFILKNQGIDRTYFEFEMKGYNPFGYASLDAITNFRVSILPTYLFANKVVRIPERYGLSIPSEFTINMKYPPEYKLDSVVSNWPYVEKFKQGEEFKTMSLKPPVLEADATIGEHVRQNFSRVHVTARAHGRTSGEQALLIGASTILGAGVSSMLEAILATGVFGLIRTRGKASSEDD